MSRFPESVGRYRIDALIGHGAMADVYRAHDPSIDRVLAIKVLKEEYRRDLECVQRFLREARAAGALSHPNIMTIYDVGESEGFAYIVMELIAGTTLDQIIANGKLPAEHVASIGVQLANALDYAHTRGVVHRDIKPSNIIMSAHDGAVKILDFGIASVVELDPNQDSNSLKTQVGQVLGTPRYMSPEQALGKKLDGRSDLFSVGAVLYELITGKKAFNGPTAVSLALQIANDDPPPIDALEKCCPLGLQFIIAKLLAKRPEKRFATGAQLADALLREQRAQANLKGDASGRRLSLPLRSTLAIAILTSAVWLFAMNVVLDRQFRAMEHMALTSGAAISSFVAANSALTAADNAALPLKKRDWRPVEAFVQVASADGNVRDLQVVDRDGVVRGASDPKLVGHSYIAAAGETIVEARAGLVITNTREGTDFRLKQPIMFAKMQVGFVDLTISKNELLAARAVSSTLLAILGAVIIGVVILATYVATRMLTLPLRRLSRALASLAAGDLDFRISHARKDEFGQVYDLVNQVADSLQQPSNLAPVLTSSPTVDVAVLRETAAATLDALERTRLAAPPANEELPCVAEPANGHQARA